MDSKGYIAGFNTRHVNVYSVKLRIASILAGVMIAVIFTFIVMGVASYVYGDAMSTSFILLILVFVLLLDIFQFLAGPYLVGRAFRTRRINGEDPGTIWILQAVEEVCHYNNEKVPAVYIAEVSIPNAFAYGTPISGRRLAVTRGLIQILDRDEVKAVIAHEIGHLKHHDVALLMAIGIVPTVIFYLGYMLLFSGGSSRNQNGYNILVALALMAVSFIFSLMILGVNRMRESCADMNSESIPGGPEKLQTALAKIVSSTPVTGIGRRRPSGSSFSNMLLFTDPSSGERKSHERLLEEWKAMKISRLSTIFSDHPHPARRIQALERIK
jgi:heat shock protein HtpX